MPPQTKDGSGFVGPVGSQNYTLDDANNLFRELTPTEILKLKQLLADLNMQIKADRTAPLDVEIEHVIRRIFRDMEPLNYGLNPELRKLWSAANRGEDTSKTYRAMRTGMTPELREELPDTYDASLYRKPEIHHATYQSVKKAWENTPENLYLTTRGGGDVVGQHDMLHRISSAAHGSPWSTLVPAIRKVIEDETGMAAWGSGGRPSYLFAPLQVGLTDSRQPRLDLNKLTAEAITMANTGQLNDPVWPFRMKP